MPDRNIVCLFDIDGTLLSTGGAGRAAFESALVDDFGLGELRGNVQMSGRTDRGIAGDLFRVHGVEDSPENWTKLRAFYLGRLPKSLADRPGRVLPGVLTLLEELDRLPHVTLGLLTGNIAEGARIKLSHFDLFHRFRFGAFGDVQRDRDGIARDAISLVRQHVAPDHPADRIWIIGDTPLDVQCARAIGAKAVAVATGIHSVDDLAPSVPDFLVADLREVADLMEIWTAA
jgi:phosphoglycolate phosphatase-like HAD superfamily hydrolase